MTQKEALRANPLFQDLAEGDLERVLEVVKEITFKAGGEIFDETLPGRELYIILKGQIRIVKSTRDGGRQTLSILKEGNFFGELSLLDGRKHSATAEAVEDSVLLVITQEGLKEIERRHPEIALTVIKNMALKISGMLRQMNEQFIGMVNYMW